MTFRLTSVQLFGYFSVRIRFVPEFRIVPYSLTIHRDRPHPQFSVQDSISLNRLNRMALTGLSHTLRRISLMSDVPGGLKSPQKPQNPLWESGLELVG